MDEMERPRLKVKFETDELYHHGIKGQKWGIRRFQNKDGSLTPEGRKHWGIGDATRKVKLAWSKSKDAIAKKKEEATSKKEKAIEDKKAKIVAKGDRDLIYKNRELFSDAELDAAMTRINKINQFKTEKGAASERSRAEKKKDAIISSGNFDKIYKNRNKFTDEELDRALKRAEKLSAINPENKKAVEKLQKTKENRQTTKDGKDVVDKLTSAGKTAIGIAGTVVGMYEGYNKVASLVNEISGKKMLPSFNLQPWKGKNEDKSDVDKLADTLLKNEHKKKNEDKTKDQQVEKKPTEKKNVSKYELSPYDDEWDDDTYGFDVKRARGAKENYLTTVNPATLFDSVATETSNLFSDTTTVGYKVPKLISDDEYKNDTSKSSVFNVKDSRIDSASGIFMTMANTLKSSENVPISDVKYDESLLMGSNGYKTFFVNQKK